MLSHNYETREKITVEHFMNLSSEINYLLSAKNPNLDALLALVLGSCRDHQTKILTLAIKVLCAGYGSSRRKIGPLAVLHPLRTAAMLSRCMDTPTQLDLLVALLHDKGEDLDEQDIPQRARRLYQGFYRKLLRTIGEEEGWYLGERIHLLTRIPNQTYNDYLIHLMDHAHLMPDLLHVKLADRLDNTLDNHIHRPGALRYNYYRTVYDILFLPIFKGVKIKEYHFLPEKEEGALLLMQLFKNAVFLTLLRKAELDKLDKTTSDLFDALAIASIRESQWIGLELFASYREKELGKLREILLDTMFYCHAGGAIEVHSGLANHPLDGLFLDNFVVEDTHERHQKMAEIFADRDYLTSVIATFITTFAAFLNDPDFSIKGIDRNGIKAVSDRNKKNRPETNRHSPAD